MEQPLVSIVTPVYNTEKYLAECVESVLSQTYSNWEYVIVNNRSTDRSLEIAESYAKREARIRIHTNEKFLSLMQNWNHSLRLISAESRYCKVVHADDWIFPECISNMVEIAEKYPSVGIVGAYRLDEDEVNLDGLPAKQNFFNGREICRGQLLGRPYLFGSPTSLLIRSDIIRRRDPFYDETTLQADKDACYEILREFDFGFVHQVLTYTRRHNQSNTANSQSFNTQRRMLTLKKYGPAFLSQREFKRLFKKAMRYYYDYLAKSLLELKDKNFIEFHVNEIKRMEGSFSYAKLAKALIVRLKQIGTAIRTMKTGLAIRRAKKSKTHIDMSKILSVHKNN